MTRRISAYSVTSGSLSINMKVRYLIVSKKKNPLFVYGCDRKNHHSGSLFCLFGVEGVKRTAKSSLHMVLGQVIEQFIIRDRCLLSL